VRGGRGPAALTLVRSAWAGSQRHGARPNEVWSYGEEAYGILRDHLLLRERLRPYLRTLSEDAHRTGAPPMRPLFFDYPEDERAWEVDDQFLLSPDVLMAPVYEAGARTRRVYLPSGTRWLDRSPDARWRAVRRSKRTPR
jgi:alpha-D-xyloside xylohydrolase